MRHVPTGVTVVTTLTAGEQRGITVSAFASVSADPPLLLICINRAGRTYPLIARSKRFCANVLSHDQQQLAERFSGSIRDNQFQGIEYYRDATGAPVLQGAIAYFDCELVGEHEAGTHAIIVGRVRSCASREGSPLGYVDGGYYNVSSRTTAAQSHSA